MRHLIRIALVLLLAACGQAANDTVPVAQISPTPLTATVIPTATVVSNADIAQIAVATAVSSQEQGTIRIVHAAPGTAAINIVSGIQAIATNLDYTQVSEPTPFDSGDHNIRVVASGSRPSDLPLFEAPFSLNRGESAVLVVAKQGENFQLFSFPQTVELLNDGESIITVANALSGTTNVEVQQNDSDLIDPVPFGETRITRILPSGETTLNFQAGDNPSQPFNVTLEEGRQYTLILTGSPENISVASFSSQSPGRSSVRAINASETLSAVDIYIGDQLVNEQAEFGRPTTRQAIIPGSYPVSVYLAGTQPDTTDPLINQIIAIPSDENIALILLGTKEHIIIVPYEEDLSPTPVGQTRIAFLNTLERVPTLHIETSGGPLPGVPDMSFGQGPETAFLNEGSLTFYMTRIGGSNANQTVENAPDVQLEAGISYLYLVTGRLDEQPVIISERVGTDETLSGASITQDEGNPALLRFINAIDSPLPINFLINDIPASSGIEHWSGSDFLPVTQPEVTISVTNAETNEFLQLVDYTLASGTYYTVIAYGMDTTHIQLMVIDDSNLIFDGRSPHLRLINLSANVDTAIGLGFSAQRGTPAVETAPDTEDIRRSIPAGVQRLIRNIAGGTTSPAILMPAGTFDIEVLDSVSNQLATILVGVNLGTGDHYDIIVYEEPETTRIRAFVVPYPPR